MRRLGRTLSTQVKAAIGDQQTLVKSARDSNAHGRFKEPRCNLPEANTALISAGRSALILGADDEGVAVSTLLVVEDDRTIAEVVAYQLQREGHQATIATDGIEALERLREAAYDLVILDLMLPRLSGLDVLRMLRRDSATPVIILSARDGDADQVSALDLGADDYITKPFSIRQLLARVAAILRRHVPTPLAPPALHQLDGEIVIDEDSHEVRKRGQIVPLAPKEFELLAFLARRPNQVCSRDAALNAVWGYGYEGETRTVDVHVHWLRRKLEDDPANPRYLITVRQYGYKLVMPPSSQESIPGPPRVRGKDRADAPRKGLRGSR